ncbi:MAG: hypothetical protein COA78_22360 [Blastopirellula sp.]|nr:MAG: hypothetical protein COA78_22360 [Blastopirellula sp.]
MTRDRITLGGCPKCEGAEMTCSYNFFDNDDLVIHSWEHKCPDCGYRVTEAYRSDDEDADPPELGSDYCPWCSRHGQPT